LVWVGGGHTKQWEGLGLGFQMQKWTATTMGVAGRGAERTAATKKKRMKPSRVGLGVTQKHMDPTVWALATLASRDVSRYHRTMPGGNKKKRTVTKGGGDLPTHNEGRRLSRFVFLSQAFTTEANHQTVRRHIPGTR